MERKPRDEWWMLAVPLELAVMARMGLHYPTVKELEANGWQDPRPLPDSAIVQEELAKLNAMRDGFTVNIPLPPDADLSNTPWSLFNAIDLDAHLADETRMLQEAAERLKRLDVLKRAENETSALLRRLAFDGGEE